MRPTKLYLAIFSLTLSLSPTINTFGQELQKKPTVSQWIKPTETGLFECQVVVPTELGHSIGLSNARVEITGANARKAVAITDEQGTAKIPGIIPGDYTLTVWAEGYVGWQSLHFLAQDDERFGNAPSQVVISPAAISLDLFEKMATPYVSSIPNLQDASNLDSTPKIVDISRVSYIPEIALVNGGLEGRLVARLATNEQLTTDGDVEGIENHLVFLIDSEDRVRQTVTKEKGEFFAENLTSGLYSIIVVGRGGISASRIEVVDPKEAATSQLINSDGKRFVSTIEVEQEFTMEITPDYDECGLPLVTDGFMLPPVGSSSGSTGGLIGPALLGTAAAVGTSAYTASAADSESTDLGGI